MYKRQLLKLGRKANNRERVIFLAEYLSENIGREALQFTCVADCDFGRFLDTCVNIPALLYTDYTCMEMYFFDKDTLDRFFQIYCNRSDWPTQIILDSMSLVLQEFFLFRLASEHLEWGMDFLDGIRCVDLRGWDILLDSKDYITRYLGKNSRIKEIEEFRNTVVFYKEKLKSDPRHQMHGHDFVDLLCWLFHQKGLPGELKNKKVVARVLAISTDVNILKEFNMFQALLSRVS